MAGHIGTKGEPGQGDRTFGRHLAQHGQHIQPLGTPFVVHSGTGTHAPKIETHRAPATLHKGPRQRLHHLVVHGAAKQGVRVGNHDHATGRGACRDIALRLNGACFALEQQFFGLCVH